MSRIPCIKAVICGAGAGGILTGGCGLFRVLMHDVEDRVGSLDKLPQLTGFLNAVLPAGEWQFWTGLLLFVVGYGLLAFLNEPSPMLCVLHVLLAVFFIAVLSAVLTYVQTSQGIKEYPNGYVPLPWFQPSRDLPWLLGCSIPLITSALIRRLRNHAA